MTAISIAPGNTDEVLVDLSKVKAVVRPSALSQSNEVVLVLEGDFIVKMPPDKFEKIEFQLPQLTSITNPVLLAVKPPLADEDGIPF